MLGWLLVNWINIALLALVVLVVALVLRGVIRDKKAGRSSCGGNCGSCAGCTGCAGGCAYSLSRPEKGARL